MIFFDDIDTSETLSLSELNERISDAVKDRFPRTYWIQAETSDVRINASSGHCYLEFIEKEQLTGHVVAKARGMIWARTFYL